MYRSLEQRCAQEGAGTYVNNHSCTTSASVKGVDGLLRTGPTCESSPRAPSGNTGAGTSAPCWGQAQSYSGSTSRSGHPERLSLPLPRPPALSPPICITASSRLSFRCARSNRRATEMSQCSYCDKTQKGKRALPQCRCWSCYMQSSWRAGCMLQLLNESLIGTVGLFTCVPR